MYNLPDLIGNYLPKDPVILEAGACNGTDTIALSQLWPKAKIYAFEPNPVSYEMLQKTVGSNPNISTFNLALGDRNGVSDFYLCRHPNVEEENDTGDASSILPPCREEMPGVSFEKSIQVPIVKLDDWAEENQIPSIDFMWLDMQGSEGHMLQASPKILQSVKAIQTEFHAKPFYEGAMLLKELDKVLRMNGFTCIFYNGGLSGDLIYIKSEFLQAGGPLRFEELMSLKNSHLSKS